MPNLIQFPFFFGVPLLPARRVIAIDPGSRSIKVVLAEVFLNRVRVIHRELIEVPDPGAVAGDPKTNNLTVKLERVLKNLGQYPVAVVVPQHVTISQVLDLPPVVEEEVERLVQNEAYKLAGLSQSKVAYDHTPLRPFGRHHNAFWITLCQENEIYSLLDRLPVERENLCGVTSVGNALSSAYLAIYPDTHATVLVDLGMRSTTIAILLDGQVVQVTNFALGNEMFLETLAQARHCSLEAAEQMQRAKNLLSGTDAVGEFRTVVNSWHQELSRLVQEWVMEHANLRINYDAFQYILSGGGARQPGLIHYLNRMGNSPAFSLWPESEKLAGEHPAGLFAVAEGAAQQVLSRQVQSASLLPLDLRKEWSKQRLAQILQSVSFFLLLLIALLLGLGTWQKFSLTAHKRALQVQAETALLRSQATERATRRLKEDYERIRPLLEHQQFTYDLLQTLGLVQQVRSNRSFWYVLFSDQHSYFNVPSGSLTNEPPATNATTGVSLTGASETTETTNRPPARPGFIAELCIPEEGEAMRRTLSQVVNALKQNPRFKNVDTVPPEQRRPLAEAKAIIPEHHFAIFLELATNEFQLPLMPVTNVLAGGTKAPVRSTTLTPAIPPPAPLNRPEVRP